MHSQSRTRFRQVAIYFVISRIILTIVGVLSRFFLHRMPTKPLIRLGLDVWANYDTGWYLSIAVHGYSTNLSPKGHANYAFFPLFPMIVKCVGYVFGNSYIFAAVLVSNGFMLGSAWLLVRLIHQVYENQNPLKVIHYFFLFPSSLFLSAALSESLYLFIVLAIYDLARNTRWFYASLLGFLLALSRPPGVFIVVPLLIEYFSQNDGLRKIQWNILFFGFIPLGTLLFAAYVYHLTGEPLGFIHIQRAWGREGFNPFRVLYKSIFLGFDKDDKANAIIGILILVILFFGRKHVQKRHLIFGLYTILIPLGSSACSMVRMNAVMFPIWFMFSKWTESNKRLHLTLSILFGLIQIFYMILWANTFGLVS